MTKTGVFATKEEIEHIQWLAQQPVMFLNDGTPMAEEPIKYIHRKALEHGLPEITGYYGCDLRTGEFLKS